MKFSVNSLSRLVLVPTFVGTVLVGCGSSSGGGSSPQVTSGHVSIDAMTLVPVVNGSATRGTLYVHNYSNVTATGLQFGVDAPKKSQSKLQSLLSSLGFKSSSLETKDGFSLLNSELCSSIPAGGSCALNFMTPSLANGDKGSSSITLNYKIDGAASSTNQIVNYQYVSLSALSGVNFTGDLTVTGAQGSTQHVVGYLYAGGNVGSKYSNVNLKSSSLTTRINNGFINGQDVASGQVIAVEFAVNLQDSHNSGVNVVPEWSGVKSNNRQSLLGAVNSGAMLSLALIPSQNTVNYIFGMVPILNAPSTTPVPISVANNGNASSTGGLTATSDNPVLQIDDSNCRSTVLQANAANTCTISFSESSATPGSAIVTFKNSSNQVVGTQNVIWTNNLPVPAVYLTPNVSNTTFAKGVTTPESSVVFLVSNVGNAPLNGTTYVPTNTGPATWVQDSTTCGAVINAGGQCSITGHFIGQDDGAGVFYIFAKGNYSSINYNFVSLPIRYMVTAAPSLVITPSGVNMTVMANGVESKTQTYTVTNQGSDPALFTSLVLNTANTQTKPIIANSSTCSSTTTLAESASCTVVVTYGPESAGNTSNESGVATLHIDYHGGTPDVARNVENSFTYTLIGNDSYVALTNTSAPNLPGNGMESSPFSGNPMLDPMLITLTYTNQSTNYAASGFNLNTNNLPYGLVVESASSTCATGANTMTLSQGASCNLVLKVARDLLTNSASGGSVVLNFTSPTGTWTTPMGFYSAPGNMIYANYLQPTVVSTLSKNNGSFESTVLTMTAVNESTVSSLTINVKGVNGWLESAPIDPSNNCTINGSDYSVSCNLKTASTGNVTYIMPNYLQMGESADIPLVFSTNAGQYAYLDPQYTFINYSILPPPALTLQANSTNLYEGDCTSMTVSAPTNVASDTVVNFSTTGSNAFFGAFGANDLNTETTCTITSGTNSCVSQLQLCNGSSGDAIVSSTAAGYTESSVTVSFAARSITVIPSSGALYFPAPNITDITATLVPAPTTATTVTFILSTQAWSAVNSYATLLQSTCSILPPNSSCSVQLMYTSPYYNPNNPNMPGDVVILVGATGYPGSAAGVQLQPSFPG